MILTLTLNAALDKTLVINRFEQNRVNRVQSLRKDPGGKGLIVAKVLNALGSDVVAYGIVGGESGNSIIKMLDEINIRHDFVIGKSETRTNIKLVESSTNSYSEINEDGQGISQDEVDKALEKLLKSVKKGDTVVLSGSLPYGINSDCYARLVPQIQEMGAKVFVDCEGESLKHIIKTKADLIKPNKFELAKAGSLDPNDDIALLEMAKNIVKGGVRSVLLSLGSYGAIYVDENICLRASGLKVPLIGRSGAGDSLVAGMARGAEVGLDATDSLRLASACAAAKIMVAGSQPPDKEMVDMLMPKVEIHKIEP